MLFRNGANSGRRTQGRSGGSSEAELRELRNRARRRLIGALALVLAAVIVVPWLFEEPVPDDTRAPIVVPAPPAGLPAAPEPAATVADASPAGGPVQTDADTAESSSQAGAAAGDATGPDREPAQAEASQAEPSQAESPQARQEPGPQPAAPAAPKPDAKPSSPAAPDPVQRTDDGSVALALLAGQAPPVSPGAAPAPQIAQGRYYLQVAAYNTEQDAVQRRDSLHQAGVTDAYVEQGQSGGRTVYRLRVGPFGSHEAAQAAQTRLRALGYQNGLISGK